MLVVPAKRKLVIDSDAAASILAAIPHAKAFVHNGKSLVALEHGQDEVKVLKNLGFKNVPQPIAHYYDWPARFPSMEHQRKTAEFMAAHDKALCLNAPGTGKTISVLWAADYLLNLGCIKKVLIIAPLSTLKPVWGMEIMHHLIHRTFNIVRGTPKKRKQLLSEDVDFCIVNHDGFTTMPNAFADFDLIVYDEVTALKTPSTDRYKRFATFMMKHAPRLWMLTGTPISQNPTDAWTLAKLAGSTTVPHSFTYFRDITMRKVTAFKWVPRDDALATCKAVLQPSIRYSLNECTDLPETTHVVRMCELTTQQKIVFDEMRNHAMVLGTDIAAPNAAVLFGKLQQICCGVAYDSDGAHIVFDDSNRVEALVEILEEIGDKAIVFVPLRGVQDRLHSLLEKRGYDVASVHGGVTGKKRDDVFDTFQNTDKIRILIAHPKVAAHGLTLTRASAIVWYAPIASLEQYEQANARIRRLSTEGKTVVFHISATSFENGLYERLRQRKRVLANFLELVQGINE